MCIEFLRRSLVVLSISLTKERERERERDVCKVKDTRVFEYSPVNHISHSKLNFPISVLEEFFSARFRFVVVVVVVFAAVAAAGSAVSCFFVVSFVVSSYFASALLPAAATMMALPLSCNPDLTNLRPTLSLLWVHPYFS